VRGLASSPELRQAAILSQYYYLFLPFSMGLTDIMKARSGIRSVLLPDLIVVVVITRRAATVNVVTALAS
jgi:hypothetical protein